MKIKSKNSIVKALERILQMPFLVSQRSSRIYSMGYNERKMDLYVVFTRDFEIYKYANIPKESWEKLEKALNDPRASLGKLFQELVVKPQYPYIICELSSSSAKKEK